MKRAMKRDDLPQVDAATAWRAVYDAACAPYRAVPGFGRSISIQWAWYWARGKLARDPVFRGMLERGDLPAQARVVDIGGGQGLVAALLHACAQVADRGGWPAAWPAAPSATAYTCIELMAGDARRGAAALSALPFGPRFVCADMRDAALPACDLVVILDVLHYVDHAAQDAVLRRVHAALLPQGRLLLRVGDAAHRRGFAISQWVDRVVTAVRGHAVPPTWGRPLGTWIALLQALGYTVHSVPMSQGTPFANVLLVADLGAPA
jgi:SAM-dependent methyltransferase